MSTRLDSANYKYSPNAKWVQTHRPECVSAIGLLLLQWNRAEEQLAWTISGIMGITLIGDEAVGHSHDWIMQTVMEETGTVHARIKIVDAILRKALETHALTEDWKQLRSQLKELSTQRNIVVHTRWAWSEDFPEYVLKIKSMDEIYGWKESDFLALVDQIKTLEDDLHRFMVAVGEAFRSGTLNTTVIRPTRVPSDASG